MSDLTIEQSRIAKLKADLKTAIRLRAQDAIDREYQWAMNMSGLNLSLALRRAIRTGMSPERVREILEKYEAECDIAYEVRKSLLIGHKAKYAKKKAK